MAQPSPLTTSRGAQGATSTAGFTIVELLIAGFILTIVLAISGTFLARQSDLNRRTQARAEVQDKVRMVMQIVSNDLALAGARVYADSSGALQTVSPGLSTCPSVSGVTSCLNAVDGASGGIPRDAVAMAYITTLRAPSEACREVAFRFTGTDLERADRGCTGSHVNLSATSGFDTLATNVLAVDVQYLCSNGAALADVPDTTSACPSGSAYVRSAVVSVVAASDMAAPGTPTQQFTTVSGTNVTCGPDVICAALTEEVLLPNLKDR